EIGHHIGGLPKYSDNNGRWASVEGQSDYFATLKCLRKVFKKYPASAINVEPAAKRDCNERYGVDTEDSRLCQRIAMASLSAAKMTATLDRGVSPRLDLRDSSVVTRTYERHPKAQCRLDTYYQGAQCEVKDSVDINDRDLYTGM